MKLKRSALVLSICFITALATAQSKNDYNVLESFISSEDIATLKNNPERHAQAAYLNRHGYYLGTYTEEKVYPGLLNVSTITKLYPNVPDVDLTLVENGSFDMIAYKIKRSTSEYFYYRFDGSDKLLVILPIKLALRQANLLND